MATKYLKQRGTGRIFVSTPILAAKPDMEAYTPPKSSALAKRAKEQYRRGKVEHPKPPEMNDHRNKPGEGWQGEDETGDEDEQPEDEGEEGEDAADDAGDLKAQVEAIKGKDKLEALARDYLGIEIDKRKSLDNLKAEVLGAIAEQEA